MAAVDASPLDSDRELALAHVPRARRAAVAALWALDLRMAAIVRAAREPALGAIRLAWWRDALVALDAAPPPAEPLLARVHAALLPAGVTGAALASLPAGWAPLLDPQAIDAAALAQIADARGATLFAAAAWLLDPGAADDRVGEAGAGWALVDVAFGLRDARIRRDALAAAASPLARAMAARWPAPLRPIGMLAALAAGDARRGARARGSPRRALRMLRHRLDGR